MGHHMEVATKSGTATTYNRDASLIVHSKVMRIIEMVKGGELKPDATRAEKLSMLVGAQAQEDAESAASDYDEAEPHGVHPEVIQQQRPCIPQDTVDEFSYVAPKLTRTVHVVQSHEDSNLA